MRVPGLPPAAPRRCLLRNSMATARKISVDSSSMNARVEPRERRGVDLAETRRTARRRPVTSHTSLPSHSGPMEFMDSAALEVALRRTGAGCRRRGRSRRGRRSRRARRRASTNQNRVEVHGTPPFSLQPSALSPQSSVSLQPSAFSLQLSDILLALLQHVDEPAGQQGQRAGGLLGLVGAVLDLAVEHEDEHGEQQHVNHGPNSTIDVEHLLADGQQRRDALARCASAHRRSTAAARLRRRPSRPDWPDTAVQHA